VQTQEAEDMEAVDSPEANLEAANVEPTDATQVTQVTELSDDGEIVTCAI